MITAEELRQRFDYNPETGIFTRTSGPDAGTQVKKSPSERYLRISIGRTGRYAVHRLAWLYVYGKWPDNQIDHINLDKSDNRICNLRDVTPRVNQHNGRPSGRAGLRGVTWYATNNKWASQICVRGKPVFLGYYTDPMDAHLHYQWARISYDREYF